MSYPAPSSLAVQACALINYDRKRRGLRALALDPQLSYFADQHSKAMSYAGKIWDPTGTELERAAQGMKWRELGGNVGDTPYDAQHQVQRLHAAFMESKPHWANIENGIYTKVGIGFRSKNDVTYETQIFFG